jgi:hypothetical protein
MVLDDWDVIRFDCRDVYYVNHQWLNPLVARTNRVRERKDCTQGFFCGGTHAMLVKEESISRLKLMWGQTPFDNIDCVIGRTEWINSYSCVNIGVGDMFNFFAEGSDIPKAMTNHDSMTTGSRIYPGADLLLHRMKAALASRASKQDGATTMFAQLALKQDAAKAALSRMKIHREA